MAINPPLSVFYSIVFFNIVDNYLIIVAFNYDQTKTAALRLLFLQRN